MRNSEKDFIDPTEEDNDELKLWVNELH